MQCGGVAGCILCVGGVAHLRSSHETGALTESPMTTTRLTELMWPVLCNVGCNCLNPAVDRRVDVRLNHTAGRLPSVVSRHCFSACLRSFAVRMVTSGKNSPGAASRCQ